MKTLEDAKNATESYYFSSQQTGIDNRCRELMIRRCLPHIKAGSSILELGFMDGQWTDHFLNMHCTVQVVEGSKRNIDFGQEKYRGNENVSFTHSLFQNYSPNRKFDIIHMGGMLKHLEDPSELLRTSREWLNPGGRLISTTPNAKSLHRRVGLKMGMLANLDDLSETDRQIGNLRHYDMQSFRLLLESSGYRVIELSTAFIKPASSEKISDWPDALLAALDQIANEIPDYGWYVYAISE